MHATLKHTAGSRDAVLALSGDIVLDDAAELYESLRRLAAQRDIQALQVARAIESADTALQGAGRVTTDASAVMANLNGTLTELKTVIQQNEEHVRATTFNLREASQSFKSLARELRQRPSRLLISEAPKERELP